MHWSQHIRHKSPSDAVLRPGERVSVKTPVTYRPCHCKLTYEITLADICCAAVLEKQHFCAKRSLSFFNHTNFCLFMYTLPGHVAHMGEERGCIGSRWGNRRERDHWGDLGVDGWIILGCISRRWHVGTWTGLSWTRIGTGGGGL